jgi:hypothetical protein
MYIDNSILANVWLEIRHRLRSLSPRDSIIILTAYADNWLIELLDQRLITTKNKRWYAEPNFGYSSRLSLAYSVGLINELSHKSLQHLGKIRNKFAHMPEADDFDNENIHKIFLEHIKLSNSLFEAIKIDLQDIISTLPCQVDKQILEHIDSVYFKYLMIVPLEVALLKTLSGITRLSFIGHSDKSCDGLASASSSSIASNQE